LDVSRSYADPGTVVPVTSPPGFGVEFKLYYRIGSNCSRINDPVTKATNTATLKAVCPPPTLSNTKSNAYEADGNLYKGLSLGTTYKITVSCITFAGANGMVPVSSSVPTSMTVDFIGNGNDALGRLVSSPPYTVIVHW